MSPRCCQSQGWDSHPRRGVQLDMTLGLLGFRPHLSLGRVYKLHIPSLWDIPIPHFRFLLCLLHPIFCIIDGPGLLGISGQGLGGGRKGHRDLRSNSCYLPSAVGGHITGDAIRCALILKTKMFTPFPPGNIGFPQFQIFNSCWWHICIFCLTWSFWCISYQNFREGWNFPNIGQFSLLYLYLGTFASAFVFLAHLHLSGQHVVSAVALLASPSGRKQKVITRSYSCWQLWW